MQGVVGERRHYESRVLTETAECPSEAGGALRVISDSIDASVGAMYRRMPVPVVLNSRMMQQASAGEQSGRSKLLRLATRVAPFLRRRATVNALKMHSGSIPDLVARLAPRFPGQLL